MSCALLDCGQRQMNDLPKGVKEYDLPVYSQPSFLRIACGPPFLGPNAARVYNDAGEVLGLLPYYRQPRAWIFSSGAKNPESARTIARILKSGFASGR